MGREGGREEERASYICTYIICLHISVHIVHVCVCKCHSLFVRRLMVMPRVIKSTEGETKNLGVFVQCNPESPETP